jgi:hypothetical protein
VFTGNGSTVAWTLSNDPVVVNNTDVSINGVTQVPTTDYTISGTTLTTTTAAPLNAIILVKYRQALPLSYYGAASNVQFTPVGALTATNVQAAIAEVVTDLALSSGSSTVGFLQAGTGAVATTAQAKLRESVSVLDFGADPTGVANSTTAIWNAIISLRANPVTILDTIGGSNITAYSSGVVNFPPGIFKISPDSLQIYQDLGLTLRGSGSRRTNNAVRASTTLLISGTSSGFGIQAYRSGGRGLTLEDMDICYETSAFTGNVLDVYDAPGVTANRCFFGTYGLTAGTRLQTAASCVRSTYDEFMHFNDCVFDGAALGWWSDDIRVFDANTFGGSLTKFDSCVFYDFANNHIYHGGTRTRTGLVLSNTAFNPISVSPTSTCLNIDNVEALDVSGCGFAASVSSAPAVQWLRVTNSTGSLRSNFVDDLAPAGQVSGMLDITGNRFAGTNGLTVLSGVITGRSNEFSAGTYGWIIAPTGNLCFEIGPDLFKAPLTNSYRIAADSAFLAGMIHYDSASDASASKFTNASSRVSIQNVDAKYFSVASTPYTVLITDTNRTILATGGSNQAFTLPTPIPGTTLSIAKVSSVNLVVTCAGGTNFYGQNSSALTVATATGAAMGTLTLDAYATVGWIVKSQVGAWTYS